MRNLQVGQRFPGASRPRRPILRDSRCPNARVNRDRVSGRIDQAAAGRTTDLHYRPWLDLLTPREFEVMQLVSTGMLNKQVGGELGTAEKTVKVHRGRVMQKLGVTSVAELVRLVQKAGVPAFSK